MLLLSILLTTSLVIFQFAECNRPEIENIEPVDLNYICVYDKQLGIHLPKDPVLLIHGLSSSLYEWNGYDQNLTCRTHRKVCSIDLRNHGNSPWNNRTDVASMTVDLRHNLIEQGIWHVTMVGHSLGGKVAVDYTLKYPFSVSSLIVEDMRPNGIPDAALLFVRALTAFYQQVITQVPDGASEEEAKRIILEELNKALVEFGNNETITPDRVMIRQVDGRWQWQFNLDVIAKALEDPEQFLGTSRGIYFGPTLFIYGTESPFDVKGDENNIMKLFPNAKLIPVEGAGHGVHGFNMKMLDENVKLLNRIY